MDVRIGGARLLAIAALALVGPAALPAHAVGERALLVTREFTGHWDTDWDLTNPTAPFPKTFTTDSFTTHVVGLEDGAVVNRTGSCYLTGNGTGMWGGGGAWGGAWYCTGDYADGGTFTWASSGPGPGATYFNHDRDHPSHEVCATTAIVFNPTPPGRVHEMTYECVGVIVGVTP